MRRAEEGRLPRISRVWASTGGPGALSAAARPPPRRSWPGPDDPPARVSLAMCPALRLRAPVRLLSSSLRLLSSLLSARASLLVFRRTMAAHATVDTSARLAALRELMAKPEHDVQALVIPTEDQRKFLSVCLRLATRAISPDLPQTSASTSPSATNGVPSSPASTVPQVLPPLPDQPTVHLAQRARPAVRLCSSDAPGGIPLHRWEVLSPSGAPARQVCVAPVCPLSVCLIQSPCRNETETGPS